MLPSWLKENNYPDIQDNVKTPFQKALNTDVPAFIYMQQNPEALGYFVEHMMANRAGMPTFLDAYPVLEKATGLSPERALFVDIGGGLGHQAISFKQRYPQLEGRVIVQDLAQTLAHAIEFPGVEKQVYDFFTPQVVKGTVPLVEPLSTSIETDPCTIQVPNSTICGISSMTGPTIKS